MIYMGEGAGGALSREKARDVLGEPGILAKARRL